MSYTWTLPRKLRCNGFDYTQLSRVGRTCLYEQTLDGNTIAFEVFTVKILPRQELFGHWLVEREVFPSNEAFGKTAWTFKKLDKATDKLVELIEKEKCLRIAS